MDKGCLPFALQSVLETLITKGHLTSWDVHGKEKQQTLVVRWDSDNTAAIARPDQSESVSFARYQDNGNCSPKDNQSNQLRTTFLLHKLLTQTLLCLKAQLHSQTHPLRSTMTVQTIAKRYRKNM